MELLVAYWCRRVRELHPELHVPLPMEQRAEGALTLTHSTLQLAPCSTLQPARAQECLEFADYTFEEHFGRYFTFKSEMAKSPLKQHSKCRQGGVTFLFDRRKIPSYPPRAVLADYIKGRIDKAGAPPSIHPPTAALQPVHSSTPSTRVPAHTHKVHLIDRFSVKAIFGDRHQTLDSLQHSGA